MRRADRIDSNQPEIIETLRYMGASVQPLHMVGKGCPDILVGFRGKNYLFEIKDGSKVPSARLLTEDESKWHRAWIGQVDTIESDMDALRAIGAVIK